MRKEKEWYADPFLTERYLSVQQVPKCPNHIKVTLLDVK